MLVNAWTAANISFYINTLNTLYGSEEEEEAVKKKQHTKMPVVL